MSGIVPGDIVRTKEGRTALVVGTDLVALLVKDDDGSARCDVAPASDLTVLPAGGED